MKPLFVFLDLRMLAISLILTASQVAPAHASGRGGDDDTMRSKYEQGAQAELVTGFPL